MAKNENKCPFCGSKEIYIKTPYTNMSGEAQYKYCCQAQKKNHEYADKHYHPILGNPPSQEEISKL